MNFYEFFFRVTVTVAGLVIFFVAMFMTFVACTNDIYPWRRAWPYVTFGWAICALFFYLGMTPR